MESEDGIKMECSNAIRATGATWKSIPDNLIKSCFINAWSRSDQKDTSLESIITVCEELNLLISINTDVQVKCK